MVPTHRSKFFLLVFIAAIFLLYFFTTNQWEGDYYTNRQLPPPSISNLDIEDLFDDDPINRSFTPANLERILKLLETDIRKSLSDYQWPPGTDLGNHTMTVKGGQPIRSVVVTTWRSGSTFLGDILNSIPGNFYHYEPLLDYGIVQIRGPPYSDSAVRNLKNLLMCDYSNMRDYLEYGKTHDYLFKHNDRLWELCRLFPNFCWEPEFLSRVCKLFPFQSMKTVRLRLKLVEKLLDDKDLNIKVLLLIRDPRAVLQSRKHRDWCPGEPDCERPNLLCADMVSDFSAAIRLKQKFPSRFRAIRYEDLCVDPYKHVQDLFDFFGLYYHDSVRKFLESHTKENIGGVSSTFRDTKNTHFQWRHKLDFDEVLYIQENCEEAMNLWGYVDATSKSMMRIFNPIRNYTVD